jgi:hypothetical protein
MDQATANPAAHRSGGSGERRLREPEQLIGFGRRGGEPIIFRSEPSELELKVAYLGTQKGDLIE